MRSIYSFTVRAEGDAPALVGRTAALGHTPRVRCSRSRHAPLAYCVRSCVRSYRTTVRRRVAVNVSPSTRTK